MSDKEFDQWWDSLQDPSLWERAGSNGTDISLANADAMMKLAARRAWDEVRRRADAANLLAAAKALLEGLERDGLSAGMGSLTTDLEQAIAKAEARPG